MSAALPRARQQGVVLFIALIVLVAMTLAGISMMRSVSTGALIADNLAFKQSAALSADSGIEAARTWLINNSGGNTLWFPNPAVTGGSAYYANWGTPDAQFGEDPTKSSYDWSTAASLATDNAGNTVSYVIQRLCPSNADPSGQQCIGAASSGAGGAGASSGTKGAAGYGGYALTVPASAVYRVTVQVKGPRNTVSYVQATMY
jgi:type IV pilus assembly protein PilX